MTALETNPRGIPKAPFIDSVTDYVQQDDTESTLRKFQEMISKYKYMEIHLLQRKKSLETKIPEMKKTLDTEEPVRTNFELSDTLWATADIPPSKSVNLWLGANVMLEYTMEEAEQLLNEKLSTAQVSLGQVQEDLEFLRDQITTMEVNTARVYNYDVKLRREKASK